VRRRSDVGPYRAKPKIGSKKGNPIEKGRRGKGGKAEKMEEGSSAIPTLQKRIANGIRSLKVNVRRTGSPKKNSC